MNKSEFINVPWHIHCDTEIHPAGDEGGLIVLADIDPDKMLSFEDRDALTTFIKSAPDMFSALKKIAAGLGDDREYRNEARAALKKARGQS